MEKEVILSTSYFGPILYFNKLLTHQNIWIEQHDHYQKQTYRNRCIILSGNGPISLTIPVIKTNGNKTKVKDIQVFNEEAWQLNHMRALEAAYKNSPFYEFYIDAFLPVWENKWKFLMDLNTFILEQVREEIEFDFSFTPTAKFLNKDAYKLDFRDSIHPKMPPEKVDISFHPTPYHQVFLDRFSFQPNLSILDLLFNKGPETSDYLLSCTR